MIDDDIFTSDTLDVLEDDLDAWSASRKKAATKPKTPEQTKEQDWQRMQASIRARRDNIELPVVPKRRTRIEEFWTPQRDKTLKEMYERGDRVREIMEALGLTKRTDLVYERIKALKLELRGVVKGFPRTQKDKKALPEKTKKNYGGRLPRAWTEEEDVALRKLYDENASISEMTRQLRISYNNINARIAKLEFPERKYVRKVGLPEFVWTTEYDSTLLDLYRNNERMDDIAKVFGVGRTTVNKRLQQLRIARRKPVKAPRPLTSKTWLRRSVDWGNLEEAARMLNVPTRHLRDAITHYYKDKKPEENELGQPEDSSRSVASA